MTVLRIFFTSFASSASGYANGTSASRGISLLLSPTWPSSSTTLTIELSAGFSSSASSASATSPLTLSFFSFFSFLTFVTPSTSDRFSFLSFFSFLSLDFFSDLSLPIANDATEDMLGSNWRGRNSERMP